MAFLLAAGSILFVWAKVRAHDKNRVAFETQIRGEQLVHSFETWIDSQVKLLEFLAADGDAPVSRNKRRFTTEISKILTLYPNFQALNWVDRDWTIRWVVPLEGNEGALDQNLRDHPNPAVPETVQRALDTDETCRTPVIDLLQGEKGFATYRAVRTASGEVVGYLNGVFRIDRIADLCTDQPRLRETFNFLILSSEGEEIYRHGDSAAIRSSPFLNRHTLTVVNRPWALLVAPTESHLRSLLNPTTNLLLAAAITLAATLAVLLGMHLHRSARIRESEEQYRLLVDNQTDMLVKFDPSGRFLFVSPSFCRTFGKQESEVLGDAFLPLVHEDDRERVRRELEKIHEPPHSVIVEERAHTTEGWRWQAWLNTAILDDAGEVREIVAVGRDITEQKELHLELAKSEERFRNLVEQASDAFFVCDAKGNIREVNDQACRILGYTREELLRLHMTEVALFVERETLEKNYASIEAHKPLRKESIHFRKDGSSFPVEVSVGLLETGKDRMHLAIARDIGDRKRAEEERRDLDRQIQQIQKLESLGVLAGGVAHDFNNILLAIIGNASLAFEDLEEGSEARGYIKEIEQAASRAAVLCNQMLAYSGRGHFVVEEIDIREAIEKVSPMLQAALSKKTALSHRFAPDLPKVEVDSGQFRQIVTNLVTNASESLEDRSGDIIVSTGAMRCDREFFAETLYGENLKEGEYVYLKVEDTGCGMDDDTKKKMFNPFFSTKFTGRGLGMAAVLGIVRGHGGAIRVESEPGVGSAITVYLPAVRMDSDEPTPEAPSEDGVDGKRRKILVVDDEDQVRDLAAKMLNRMGFVPLVAADGREGIRIFEEHRTDIGCVILDLIMPGFDGEETLTELKKMDPNVRILLSSGCSDTEVKHRFAGKGLTGYLQKPYQYATLETRVLSALHSPETG